MRDLCHNWKMREIALNGKKANGRVALVDDEDYELVSVYRWHVQERVRKSLKMGFRTEGPYAMASIRLPSGKETGIFMHKLITGWPMTDHINHNGLDNRRFNLRPTNPSLNAQNQRLRTDGASRYKGVYWHKGSSKWAARIQVSGERTYLGLFEDEQEAARAYDAAVREAYPHAFLNFPDD